MIVTDHFVFIHMHKAGGNFVIKLLKEYFPGTKSIGYHYPASMIPEKYKHLPVVGFIRNPWDWYVSWYCFLQSHKPGSDPLFDVLSNNSLFGFKKTITNLVNLGVDNEVNKKFRQQLIQRLPETIEE
jgi:hypothetical protein